MVVVPRLFEVLRTRITKQVEKQGNFANYLLERAIAIGDEAGRGRRMPLRDMPMNLFLNATLRPKLAKRSAGGSRRWFRAGRRSIPRSACSSSRWG
jgi:long-chain acyl-CoA synthetase